MNLKTRLAKRIQIKDIHEIVDSLQTTKQREELYSLIFDAADFVSYQALWVLTHFPAKENKWIASKQDELIDLALLCTHDGKRRLLLTLLYQHPLKAVVRIDFLDFCLERMVSPQEPVAIQSVSMRIAYELCLPFPELIQEFRATLDLLETASPQPSIRAVRKNILKAMESGKSLQA